MPATQTTRRRALPYKGVSAKGHYDSGAGTVLDEERSLAGTQVTVSTGHPFSQHKGNLDDIGGDFYTSKQTILSKVRRVNLRRVVTPGTVPQTRTYSGVILPCWPPGTPSNTLAFPPPSNSSNATLDKLGATAIARCAPGNPPSDLATFLGELRQDGIPALVGAEIWKSKTRDALKATGNDYLNASFGWAPMLSDISSFAHSITKSDSLIRQYERDSGKVVRRRYYFPSQRDVTETEYSSGQFITMVPNTSAFQDVASGNKVTRIREITRRQWFSGAFTYYLPSGYDSRETIGGLASKAEFLLGTSLTPQTLWNITPWSWAIDWFSNTGDVIKNVQRFATGGLIMRYGYMMEHTIVNDIYTYSGSPLIGSGAAMPAPLILQTETKVRRGANPFGFGVTWGALSAFQNSIIAALGITHHG